MKHLQEILARVGQLRFLFVEFVAWEAQKVEVNLFHESFNIEITDRMLI